MEIGVAREGSPPMVRRAKSKPSPVGLKDREGVFVHAFKCRRCLLEFQLYSWRRDRHKVGQVFCPECGERTRMLHWRAGLDASPEGTSPAGAQENRNPT